MRESRKSSTKAAGEHAGPFHDGVAPHGFEIPTDIFAPEPRRRSAKRAAKASKPAKAPPKRRRGGVGEVMTRDVVSVREDTTVASIADIMLRSGLSALPVTDDDGTLVGIVSNSDLVREQTLRGDDNTQEPVKLRARRGVLYSPGPGFHIETLGDVTAGDVMSRKVVAVDTETSIPEAVRLMTSHHVHRLPVVEGGRLVGIVSTMDLLGYYAGAGRRQATTRR